MQSRSVELSRPEAPPADRAVEFDLADLNRPIERAARTMLVAYFVVTAGIAGLAAAVVWFDWTSILAGSNQLFSFATAAILVGASVVLVWGGLRSIPGIPAGLVSLRTQANGMQLRFLHSVARDLPWASTETAFEVSELAGGLRGVGRTSVHTLLAGPPRPTDRPLGIRVSCGGRRS